MNSLFTSQDGFSFSADGTYSMGAPTEEAQGRSRPDNRVSTYYEHTMPWYDECQSLNPPSFNRTLFPVFFKPSNQTTAESIPADLSMLSSIYAPSTATLHNSVGAPAMTTVAPASTFAPPTPTTNVTTRRRFGCLLCPKTFDRLACAEACHNEHVDWKPYVCRGDCGTVTYTAAYFSIENLRRHTRPVTKRKLACPSCARSFLKQNLSRHKRSCI